MNVDYTTILNIPVSNVRQEWLLRNLKQGVVFTPNIDHFVRLQKDKLFYHAYKSADYILLDSQVLFLLLKRGKKILEKISGVDFFPEFCRYNAVNENVRIFLLGGLDNSVHRAAEKINIDAGRNIVVDSYSGVKGFEHDLEECLRIIERIKKSAATVLAVGIGSPQQEIWIQTYKPMLPSVRIFFAVGGTFDILSGKKNRAPVWMQKGGVEWLYRLIQEPRRLFRRYLITDIQFFYYFLLERLHFYKNPFEE